MEITTGLLCDFAQVREGLLFVLSGGVTRLHRPELPGAMGLCAALVVTLDAIEMERPHEFRLVVVDQDGNRVAEAQGGFQITPSDSLHVGEKQQVPIAVDHRFAEVSTTGAHDVVVYVDGHRMFETTFYVTNQLPGAPGGHAPG